jgi:septum site-determining protein MinC
MKLRGIQDDFVMSLNGRNWIEMLTDLASQLEMPRGPALHPGANLWLEAFDCSPSMSELERLVWLLELHNMKLEGWTHGIGSDRSSSEGTQRDPSLTPSTEIAPRGSRVKGQAEDVTPSPDRDLSEGALISRTLRSGQVVHYAGTVIILGDVNPGAVVVAEGNVIVWGRLRGVVHAGASGDAKAFVGALELAPSELRIGGHVARAPDANRGLSGGAELARMRSGRIVIEDWDDSHV